MASGKGSKDKDRPNKQRVALDVYPTEERVVGDFLRRWEAARGEPLPGGVWAEPAVCDGAILRAVRAHAPDLVPPENWRTCEIRPEAVRDWPEAGNWYQPRTWRHHTGDFLALKPGDPFWAACADVAVWITNPPFAQAEAFVRQCQRMSPRAWVVMLFRLNFIEGDRRLRFWKLFTGIDVFPIVPRPSFGTNKQGKLGSDRTAYAFFVFSPAGEGPPAVRLFLPDRPWRETPRTRREAKEQAAAKKRADRLAEMKREKERQGVLFPDPPSVGTVAGPALAALVAGAGA